MTRVTVDDMVEAIREAKKPVTAAEIAEATDVTRQAIGKRREQLEADDRVDYGKVGSATAYWLKSWVEETDKQPPTEPGAGSPPERHPTERRTETSSETERDEVPPAESQETRAKKLVANMFVDLAGVLGKWSVVLAVITLGLYVSPLPAANPEAVPIFLALAAAMGLTGVLFVSVAALIHVRLLGNSAADTVSEITRAKT